YLPVTQGVAGSSPVHTARGERRMRNKLSSDFVSHSFFCAGKAVQRMTLMFFLKFFAKKFASVKN
ncbi:MAG: hypothetical protein K2I56_03930, partial [Muribaculaceae bacterium]|nr:hypothetical protein [Muribaculaceae bacterium]